MTAWWPCASCFWGLALVNRGENSNRWVFRFKASLERRLCAEIELCTIASTAVLDVHARPGSAIMRLEMLPKHSALKQTLMDAAGIGAP